MSAETFRRIIVPQPSTNYHEGWLTLSGITQACSCAQNYVGSKPDDLTRSSGEPIGQWQNSASKSANGKQYYESHNCMETNIMDCIAYDVEKWCNARNCTNRCINTSTNVISFHINIEWRKTCHSDVITIPYYYYYEDGGPTQMDAGEGATARDDRNS